MISESLLNALIDAADLFRISGYSLWAEFFIGLSSQIELSDNDLDELDDGIPLLEALGADNAILDPLEEVL